MHYINIQRIINGYGKGFFYSNNIILILTYMKYYLNKTIKGSYNEVLVKVTEAIKTEGFGIVSEIRMN
jgi:hypothetical protein